MAAETQHLSVDLQGGVARLHVEDLAEAFGLFLQGVDGLRGKHETVKLLHSETFIHLELKPRRVGVTFIT